MRKTTILIIASIIAFFAVAVYFYPLMPDRMASHWDSQGQVNGYMGRFWGVFLVPIIVVAMLLLFLFIPKLDPMKKNIESFRKYFDWFIVLMMVFMLYLYLLTLAWNLNHRFNMVAMLVPAFGILFFYMGVLVSHARQNWFIGIRTPWTLSSKAVWDKTHKLGGKLFKLAGIISFLGIIFQTIAIWLILVPVILVALWTTVYSYLEFRKEKNR